MAPTPVRVSWARRSGAMHSGGNSRASGASSRRPSQRHFLRRSGQTATFFPVTAVSDTFLYVCLAGTSRIPFPHTRRKYRAYACSCQARTMAPSAAHDQACFTFQCQALSSYPARLVQLPICLVPLRYCSAWEAGKVRLKHGSPVRPTSTLSPAYTYQHVCMPAAVIAHSYNSENADATGM